MTEYWVSQGRKFCEFCNCSIADNKPSIQFHENGKKHKQNVAKKLFEMRKKATKEAKNATQVTKQIKRMESAALQAYMKDIETTPDFQSESIRKVVADAEAEKREKDRERETQKKLKQEAAESSKKSKSKKRWLEGVTEDGKKYYYNLNTGESSEEPPPQGYKSLAEQEFVRDKLEQKRSKLDVAVKNEEIYRPKFKPVQKKPEEDFWPTSQSSNHPYGAWQKVVPEPEPVDLQLPERPEYVPIVVPSLSEEPERKFKEKKLPAAGSIDSFSGETSFRKRKFSGNPKKNMRQRLDDE